MTTTDLAPATQDAAALRPMRFGVLGAARIARGFVKGVAGSPKVVVSHVASRDAARAAEFARATGVPATHESYEALLADPTIEAVYNPLPNALHAPWSIQACEAGKHVLCEKPLALSAEEAQRMFDAAKANGVLLFEAYPYLAQPQTRSVRELVARGEIGALKHIQASFGFTLAREGDIRFDTALGGGALLDVGSYPVSLVRALAGERPTRVRAVATGLETGVDRSTFAILEHADGLVAQVSGSFETALYKGAVVMGETGVVETSFANHISPDRPAWLRIKRGANLQAFEELSVGDDDGFRLEAESFVDAVREGADRWTGATPQESLDIALTLEAIARSARTGEPVTL